MRYSASYLSPMGEMLIVATADALIGLYFVGQKYFPRAANEWRPGADNTAICKTIDELDRYFSGDPMRFTVPLAPFGTSYQHAIWKAISTVEYGATITYSELARRAGYPGNARAAGTATGQNPIGIIVPCHRIIGANGQLTGYAGGLDKKRALLALEAGCRQATLAIDERITVGEYRPSGQRGDPGGVSGAAGDASDSRCNGDGACVEFRDDDKLAPGSGSTR